jgi:hypothetical protein
MTVTEVLQFIDQLVFERTGKHLDDLQMAIVEGSFQRQTYDDIAQKCHVSKNHATDIGSKLWSFLSEELGEDIKKNNFRYTFERLKLSSSIIINTNGNNDHSFNFCLLSSNEAIQKDKENNPNNKLSCQDITLAPQIIEFYHRETELETLVHWILNQNINLVSVLGLSGIGKTTLVKRFVDLNLDRFEVIIWKNLNFTPSLNQVIREILTKYKECSNEKFCASTEVCQFLNLLKEKRCLIILDNVENIFISGQFAGQYQPEYQDYQNLFKMISETEHQSNIVLISQEKCAEMYCLDERLYSIKCLELSGLNDIDFLQNVELKDKDFQINLLNLYEANPFYLKEIAILINDIFDGSVADFLVENNLIIPNNIQYQFQKTLKRLSSIEREIITELSKFDQPIAIKDLKESLELSSVNLISGLESLQRRYLLKKAKANQKLFHLSPVFKEYITYQFSDKKDCLN